MKHFLVLMALLSSLAFARGGYIGASLTSSDFPVSVMVGYNDTAFGVRLSADTTFAGIEGYARLQFVEDGSSFYLGAGLGLRPYAFWVYRNAPPLAQSPGLPLSLEWLFGFELRNDDVGFFLEYAPTLPISGKVDFYDLVGALHARRGVSYSKRSSKGKSMGNHILRNRRALVEQLYDYLNHYDFGAAATMVISRNTDNYLFHWQDVRRTFPDFRLELLDIIIQDEWIAVRSLFSGTHRGTAKLLHHGGLLLGVKPTGRTVSVGQMHVYQVVAGKLLELYVIRDDISLYQQLRLLPQLETLQASSEMLEPVPEDFTFLAR